MTKFFEDEAAQANLAKSLQAAARGGNVDPTVIPVVREELVVSKRVVDTGQGVRVNKTVANREELVDELLLRDDVVVERVAIDEIIPATDLPNIRYEGDTMIVPVLEEILVVEKRMMLKEEVRITSTRREVRDPQCVVLRSEEVSIEHFDEALGQPSNLP